MDPIFASQVVVSAGIASPTSLQFGPDGRLYVSQQDGTIRIYTVAQSAEGTWSAALAESIVLSIPNHDDDGTLNAAVTARQVTGILVTGTADEPVIYVTSSDPRIGMNADLNLDTNSGILSRLTFDGTSWARVDLIRGLPRSEENHSTNGMALSADGTKLYVTQGGNTNNGAPSEFFAYLPEYALAGATLEVDLLALEQIPDKTWTYSNGETSVYKYDLPSLDDPTVANDGAPGNESADGMDVSGPFGGNDGFNQAVLPADAPLRIYATGFRNQYDVVVGQNGNMYTIDNGANAGLGGGPVFDGGVATNDPSPGGEYYDDNLHLVEDGGYYGHPVPSRANQDAGLTDYDKIGDEWIPVFSVPSLADLVPAGVQIADGFLIDPSKFTADPTRLAMEGQLIGPTGIPADDGALAVFGASTNGLAEYTAGTFDGAMLGDLITASFDGTVKWIKLNADGTASEGVINIANIGGVPLDVTMGPGGTIWVAQIGSSTITVLVPTDEAGPADPDDDDDDDGIPDIVDAFQRDASNGASVMLLGGDAVTWDFSFGAGIDPPGPDGIFLGLTGHMVNGLRDHFAPPENGGLDLANVKIGTAAGGGLVVVEEVSDGDATGSAANDGEYLFQTGVTIAPNVEAVTVRWTIKNPFPDLATQHDGQQIGGYIGTGDQDNFLKLAVGPNGTNEAQFVLESGGVEVMRQDFDEDALFTAPALSDIVLELTVDLTTALATPRILYATGAGGQAAIDGAAIYLFNTDIYDAIVDRYAIGGLASGLAIGLWSTNAPADGSTPSTFQAAFDSIEVATTSKDEPLIKAVNVGGDAFTASNGIAYEADSEPASGVSSLYSGADDIAGPDDALYNTERWAPDGGNYTYEVPVSNGLYRVQLEFAEIYNGIAGPGQRVFDVSVEGQTPAALQNIDMYAQVGPDTPLTINQFVQVTDGSLSIQVGPGSSEPGNVENAKLSAFAIFEQTEPLPLDVLVKAVNVGGSAFTASNGIAYEADSVPASGVSNVFSTSDDIAGVDDPLYSTERWAPLGESYTYEIPVTNGLYRVQLEFAEIDNLIGAAGERVFDLSVEGQSPAALQDIDLYAQVGSDAPWTIEQFVQVNDGSLSIQVGPGSSDPGNVGNAKLNAFAAFALSFPSVTQLSDASANETAGQMAFTVGLSRTPASPVTVTYAIKPGTATAVVDYTGIAGTTFDAQTGIYQGTIVIDAGTTGTILVDIANDAIAESIEAFTVEIVSATMNGIALNVIDGVGTGTIVDTIIKAVNVGGEAFTASNGIAYEADIVPTSGESRLFSANDDIAGPDDPIYNTERWAPNGGSYTYEIPVTNGVYRVQLEFAEIYNLIGAAGERVFDVSVEGQSPAALQNIDMYAQAGPDTPLTIDQIVQVFDGSLSIQVGPGSSDPGNVENAKLSAFVIFAHDEPLPLNVLIKAVNVGGGAFTASNGIAYEADSAPTAGQTSVYSESDDIAGPDDPLYNTERWAPNGGSYTYEVAVTNGTYLVQLEFAEIYFGITGPGLRVFDVSVEGQSPAALQNIDIFAQVGPDAPLTVSQVVEVTDGSLSIQVGPGSSDPGNVENAKLSAFAIFGQSSPLPSVTQLSDASVNESAGQVAFTVGLSTAPASAVTITYAIKPGTAMAVVDYTGVAGTTFDAQTGIYQGTIVIDAGTTGTILIDIANDDIAESIEAFTVEIVSANMNGTALNVIDGIGTGTIVDEDTPANPQARFQVTPGGSINASTFNDSSFVLTNIGDTAISSFTIDLSNSLIAGAVFDPDGISGDTTALPFTPSASNPIAGSASLGNEVVPGGFRTLTVTLAAGGLLPGQQFAFKIDVDPASIDGPSPGPNESGSISGFELIGAQIGITYANGNVQTGELFEDGSQGGGDIVLSANPLPEPTLSIESISDTPIVTQTTGNVVKATIDGLETGAGQPGADVVIVVTGSPGQTVRLSISEMGGVGMDIALGTHEGNTVFQVPATIDAVIGAGGVVEVPISLPAPSDGIDGDSGLYTVTAAIVDAGGDVISLVSKNVVLKDGTFLEGTAEVDTFQFKAGFADTTIMNFEVSGASHDVIELERPLFAEFAAISDLLASAQVEQDGANVIINDSASSSTITLINATLASVQANPDAFHFVG